MSFLNNRKLVGIIIYKSTAKYRCYCRCLFLFLISTNVFASNECIPYQVDMLKCPSDRKGAMSVFSWAFEQAPEDCPVMEVWRDHTGCRTLFPVDPLLVKALFKNHEASFVKGSSWDGLRELLGNQSIICTQGGDIHRKDKECVRKYIYPDHIKDYQWRRLESRVDHCIDEWETTKDLLSDVRATLMRFFMDLFYSSPHLTNSISEEEIIQAGLSVSTALKDAFVPMFKVAPDYSLFGNTPLLGLNRLWHKGVIHTAYPGILATRAAMTEFVEKRLEFYFDQVASINSRPSYVEYLVRNTEGEEVLRTHMRTIILAGLDTTAPTVTFFIEKLMLEGELQEKIYQEVKANDSTMGTWPESFKDISFMPEFSQVVERFLKENPAIGVTFRDVIRPIVVQVDIPDQGESTLEPYDVCLRKGDRVVINLFRMTSENSFNKKRYGAEVMEKMPALTFLNPSMNHLCPGNKLARIILKTMVARCLMKKKIVPVESSQKPVNKALQVGIVPFGRIPATFVGRDS